MTRPKARPIEIQMADSMAASLIEMTCAVLCTSSRSMTSIAVMAETSATQAQSGTSKLAKFSLVLSALAKRGLSNVGMGSGDSSVRREPSTEGLSHPSP